MYVFPYLKCSHCSNPGSVVYNKTKNKKYLLEKILKITKICHESLGYDTGRVLVNCDKYSTRRSIDPLYNVLVSRTLLCCVP